MLLNSGTKMLNNRGSKYYTIGDKNGKQYGDKNATQ